MECIEWEAVLGTPISSLRDALGTPAADTTGLTRGNPGSSPGSATCYSHPEEVTVLAPLLAFLDTLLPEQRIRVLTEVMGPKGLTSGAPVKEARACLVEAAFGLDNHRDADEFWGENLGGDTPLQRVANAYDDLCVAFGTEEVNARIREYILRTMPTVPERAINASAMLPAGAM